MKVEIWSDVVCPFCYIGKKRFEKALKQFDGKEQIEVEWRSYMLDPNGKTMPEKNPVEHLAERKGESIEWAQNAMAYVSKMAAQEGLQYHLENSVVANTFRAHQFLRFAQEKGKGVAAHELVFKAYFTEGKNVDDLEILLQIGKSIGFGKEDIEGIWTNEKWANDVKADLSEAAHIGVTGVPFFVFNRKYAISGAQETPTFLNALQQISSELSSSNTCDAEGCGC